MSEEKSKDERTEPASAERRKQFRDRGEIAKSKEVASAVLFLVGAAAMAFGAPAASKQLAEMFREGILMSGEAPNLGGAGLTALGRLLSMAAPVLFVVLALTSAVAMASHLMQTGLLWTGEPLKPNFGRMAPLGKLKRMFFSKDTVIELLKTLAKVGALGFIGWHVIASFLPAMATLPLADLTRAGGLMGESLQLLLAAVGAGAVVIAALDYAWQRRQMEERMKMTKDEVRRERMQQEGNPLYKGVRQRKHRELSMNRMLRDVPEADVVVTNPTHFAVALRYRPEEGGAPRVIAKGKDKVALRIRAEARRHGIPVVEQKTLARALHKHVKIGHEVPAKLYQAVAEVLAYIFRLNAAANARRRAEA